MIERIKSLMAVKNLSSAQLAAEIGVQRSGISHILSGRNKPSLDFVMKLLDHYPKLSENWLLKGTGEMFKDAESQQSLFIAKPNEEEVVKEESNHIEEDLIKEEPQIPYGIQVEQSKESIQVENPKVKTKKVGEKQAFIPEALLSNKSDAKLVKLIAIYSDHTFEEFNARKQ